MSDLSVIVPQIKPWFGLTMDWHIVNAYGGYEPLEEVYAGRPEIIFEGSNTLEGPWLEYPFLFKPGNVNNTLPFVGKFKTGCNYSAEKRFHLSLCLKTLFNPMCWLVMTRCIELLSPKNLSLIWAFLVVI